MKQYLIILIALFISQNIFAEKYALIIAVGDYPARTGWSSISSVNDVSLINEALTGQGFLEDNITTVINEAATKEGILQAIANLQSKVKPGDIVVIHYSGHGQQIFDDNGEEIDNMDEAIVPYDALVKYTSNYKGENHIRDDQIGNIIAQFRNSLGKDGQLLLLLDSCHSGSATRGGKARGGIGALVPPDWDASSGNKTTGSGMVEGVKTNEDAAPFVMLSGASADELNYEYEGYGSLSFAFSKAMNELGSDVTYRKLFSAISANMNVISPKQTPTIEGDTDFKLFNGEYVKQQPYFETLKIARPDVIKINAGKLQRLFVNTTVNILPAGTTQVEDAKVISTGTITKATFNESIIKLNTPLSTNNTAEYWVFVDQPSYGDISLDIHFESELIGSPIAQKVASFLKEKNIGTIKEDTLNTDLIISELNNTLLLQKPNGKEIIESIDKVNDNYPFDQLTSTIFNYAQGSYLKELSLKNFDYEFEFRLLPAARDELTDEIVMLEPNAFTDEAGKLKVNTTGDIVYLEVTNRSSRPIYFSIIEINSKGEIAPFMPNDDCSLNDNERLIPPGKTMVFKDCYYEFGDPYETLILKGFATPMPINFRPTVQSRGNPTAGNSTNPLEGLIGQSFSQSRGSKSSRSTDRVDGYSTEFVYEIVQEKD